MKTAITLLLSFMVLSCFVLVSCGGGSNSSSSGSGGNVANVTGQWEITLTSTVNPTWTTYFELALTQTGSNIPASTESPVVFGVNREQGVFGTFVASCVGGFVTASISGSTITGTFNTNQPIANFSGTLPAATGEISSFSGTYASIAGNQCQDQGTFTATEIPPLSGTLSGQITFDQTVVDVAATVTETVTNSNNPFFNNVTANAQFSGGLTETETFTGRQWGDLAGVTGTITYPDTNLYVWFDRTTNTAWVADQNQTCLYGSVEDNCLYGRLAIN